MLLELRAENYAVIDRAKAQFGRGLNLLTGETGAGKSILIDALALLLGGKASVDVIRHGSDKAVVSCTFELTPGAKAVLDLNGLDSDAESEEISLRREIVANGKGRVFINNQPATVSVLRQLAPELALVHAQGEMLESFNQSQQRILLDRYGGIRADEVAAAYVAWRSTRTKLEQMLTDERDRLRMADLWRFQSREIDQAALLSDQEDIQLQAEKRVLGNAEKLHTTAMSVQDLLYEAEHAAETTMGQALKLIEELARYDERFLESVQQLQTAKATVEDISATVRDFAETVQSGPERLNEVEDRLAELDRLKRKYGKTLSDVITFGSEATRQLLEVENREVLLVELRTLEEQQALLYVGTAEALTDRRIKAATRFAKAAETEINDLAMSVRFMISVEPSKGQERWTARGWDEISYSIATNAGQPMSPLEDIASGGEMSRVMLALKVTVEEATAKGPVGNKREAPQVRTLVFDEIDIGIGGRAAEAVGQKLKALSRTQQVLCITHLPQIAAFADQHFLIVKDESRGRSQTDIRRMEEDERVREIARMLSGAKLTETSLRHAENLLSASR